MPAPSENCCNCIRNKLPLDFNDFANPHCPLSSDHPVQLQNILLQHQVFHLQPDIIYHYVLTILFFSYNCRWFSWQNKLLTSHHPLCYLLHMQRTKFINVNYVIKYPFLTKTQNRTNKKVRRKFYYCPSFLVM